MTGYKIPVLKQPMVKWTVAYRRHYSSAKQMTWPHNMHLQVYKAGIFYLGHDQRTKNWPFHWRRGQVNSVGTHARARPFLIELVESLNSNRQRETGARGADQVYLIRSPVPWSAGQIIKNTSGQLGKEFLRISITRDDASNCRDIYS